MKPMDLFKSRKPIPTLNVLDVGVEELATGMRLVHKRSGQTVTVNYVQKNKVNYRAENGDYSMMPEHFVQIYGRQV